METHLKTQIFYRAKRPPDIQIWPSLLGETQICKKIGSPFLGRFWGLPGVEISRFWACIPLSVSLLNDQYPSCMSESETFVFTSADILRGYDSGYAIFSKAAGSLYDEPCLEMKSPSGRH